jgi:hypothetical protein
MEVARQEEKDKWIREEIVTVGILVDEESTEEEDQEDDEITVDESEIWQVTDVTEKDVETTEGEAVDLYDKLMEMSGWKVTVTDKEKENDLP